MNRQKPRPTSRPSMRAAQEEVVPRSTRRDPRSDPDEVLGGDKPKVAATSAAAAAAVRTPPPLPSRAQTQPEPPPPLVGGKRTSGQVPIDRSAGEAARLALRVQELERQLAQKNQNEAELERLLDGTMTERDRIRGQAEEIHALRLALDCARAENGVLQERLGEEHAQKERLLAEVARIQALLDGVKKLAR